MQFSEEFIKYDGDSFQQATLLDYEIGKPVSLQNPMYNWLGYGNYSLTGFEVLLTRYRGRYLMYTHMPSALFVCVSWISFIVPVEAIPGRITLLVTLLLVLINIFNTSVDHQPLSDTITAGSGNLKIMLHTVPYGYWIMNYIFSLDPHVHLLCIWCTPGLRRITLHQVLGS